MKVKKFLSTFLVMAMVISLMPGITLRAEAAAPTPDYTITGGPTSFQVDGSGDYGTLTAALGECTAAGGDELVIQFGNGGAPLEVDEYRMDVSADLSNNLVSATYTGSLQINRNGILANERTYGINVPSGTTVEFNDLTVTVSGTSGTTLYGVYVDGGTLYVEGNTSITVNGAADCVIQNNNGEVTVNSGTLTASDDTEATNDTSMGIANYGTGSLTINGGRIDAAGDNSIAIKMDSTGALTITGGTVTASKSDYGADNFGISAYRAQGITISGGSITACGRAGDAIGVQIYSRSNYSVDISGSAYINGNGYGLYTEQQSGVAAINISGGTITSEGVVVASVKNTVNISGGSVTSTDSMGIYAYQCSVNITGGTVKAEGTGAYTMAAYVDGTAAFPASVNISGDAKVISNTPYTICLRPSADPDCVKAEIFGKSVFGDIADDISIEGSAVDGFNEINSGNYGDASVRSSDASGGFACWTSDPARTDSISTANPDSVSNLTTGANSAVTSIYLKTSTPPDYTIINGSSDFDVVGIGNYGTLAAALAVCTEAGPDGVLTIQLGDGSTPLVVPGINDGSGDLTSNDLIAATYTGSLKMTYSSSSGSPANGKGVEVEAGTVKFKDLTVTTEVSGNLAFFWPILVNGGALSIEGGTSITGGVNTVYGIYINSGSLAMSGGTISSAGSGIGSAQSNTSGTITISGGTIESSGVGSAAIRTLGADIIMTGGNVRSANSGSSGANYGISATDADVTVSGGAISCMGTHSLSAAIYSLINGTNTSIITVSSNAEVMSASANTILLSMKSSASGTENAVVFGKTIHSSNDFYISIMGAASSGNFKIASSNVSDAALIAFYPYSTTKSFAGWTSDESLNNEISSVNGDRLSALTTGENAAVTDIYLKTGTDTTVVLAGGSPGTIGDRCITGLTAGTKYKVTMGSVTYYAKADGRLSPIASDAAALTGTEIVGLTNHTAYLVEVYSAGGGAPSGGSSGKSSSSENAAVVVDGKSQTAGTVSTTTQDGKTTTTVTISRDKLGGILESTGRGATVTIPINTGSDTASGRLDGQAVKDMENKDATLVIQTGSASYTLPASQIDIDSVSGEFGTNVSLSDIIVNVSISEPSGATVKIVENAAASGGFSLVVPAVEFTVSCTYGGQTVNVSSFYSYVERMIAIPSGIDPGKITTGIVVEPDGSTHHVPTEIIVLDGVYYARINSLTNSVYSIIYNPVEFSDVENHWAENSINNMGSRLVVNGVGNNNYDPDRGITRAEFAAVMVKALGLEPGSGTNSFYDVSESAWYCGYIETASSYGIIKGYSEDTFGPNDTITREQAMAMIARAMKITDIKVGLTDSEINQLLKVYVDGVTAADYAEESIAACLTAGIVFGTGKNTMSPKNYVTRAEVAVMVERLLRKSGLI